MPNDENGEQQQWNENNGMGKVAILLKFETAALWKNHLYNLLQWHNARNK